MKSQDEEESYERGLVQGNNVGEMSLLKEFSNQCRNSLLWEITFEDWGELLKNVSSFFVRNETRLSYKSGDIY